VVVDRYYLRRGLDSDTSLDMHTMFWKNFNGWFSLWGIALCPCLHTFRFSSPIHPSIYLHSNFFTSSQLCYAIHNHTSLEKSRRRAKGTMKIIINV